MVENAEQLTGDLGALLERDAEQIRAQWVKEMNEAGLLLALSAEEKEQQSREIYEAVIACIKTASYEYTEKYAAERATQWVSRGIPVDQVITGVVILRDILGRSIFEQLHKNPGKWESTTLVYEPIVRRIVKIVALALIVEREAVIRQQQEAILKMATPIVEAWESISMVPLIGTLDSARAKQLTESVLNHIAQAKTDIVVLDISGIAAVDTKAANHILRAIQAVRLMGSDVVVTGIRPDVATTIITLGVDLSDYVTRSTLREGLEYAYKKLGLKVTKTSET